MILMHLLIIQIPVAWHIVKFVTGCRTINIMNTYT